MVGVPGNQVLHKEWHVLPILDHEMISVFENYDIFVFNLGIAEQGFAGFIAYNLILTTEEHDKGCVDLVLVVLNIFSCFIKHFKVMYWYSSNFNKCILPHLLNMLLTQSFSFACWWRQTIVWDKFVKKLNQRHVLLCLFLLKQPQVW